MREWLASVMAAAVTAALAELLAPEGKTRRYVSFALAAILLLVLLAPLAGSEELIDTALDALDFSADAPAGDGNAAADAVMRASETALSEAARRELGLGEGTLRVSLSYTVDAGEVRLTGVKAYVSAFTPTESLRRYLERETGVKCEVIAS